MSRSAQIRQLLSDGLPAPQVAAQLGVSIRWVNHFIRNHGLPHNRPLRKDHNLLRKMLRSLHLFNYNYELVGQMYGYSPKALAALHAEAYPPSAKALPPGESPCPISILKPGIPKEDACPAQPPMTPP